MQNNFSTLYINTIIIFHSILDFKKFTTTLYSSIALTSTPFLNICGKNSQTPVTATNATVTTPDTALCNLNLPSTTFLTATSTAVHTPCTTKNHVTSHVGLTRVKYQYINSCINPDTTKVATIAGNRLHVLPITGDKTSRTGS
ncbi:hypothetical protein Hanom_Chr05g00468471 [Helianthus anomalus]